MLVLHLNWFRQVQKRKSINSSFTSMYILQEDKYRYTLVGSRKSCAWALNNYENEAIPLFGALDVTSCKSIYIFLHWLFPLRRSHLINTSHNVVPDTAFHVWQFFILTDIVSVHYQATFLLKVALPWK